MVLQYQLERTNNLASIHPGCFGKRSGRLEYHVFMYYICIAACSVSVISNSEGLDCTYTHDRLILRGHVATGVVSLVVRTWSLGRSMSGTLACSGVEDMSRCDEDSRILLLLLPVSAKLQGRGSHEQLLKQLCCMYA